MSIRDSLTATRGLGAIAAALLLIQLVPVDRSNPPVEEEVAAPAAVREILRTSCYDCHSHESTWPWYAYVAPVSWLVAHDVEEAREHLNFSTWNDYDEEEQIELLEEVWEEVEDGEMPLWFYVPLHPEAELSEQQRGLLHSWVEDMTDD
jgi:mono/diheme cytochrome c family protein